MTDVLLRDAAATVAVFGFFASTWFGWAQEHPPPAWRHLLVAGSLASVLTALVGGLLTWRHWSAGTVSDAGTGRAFGIIVGVELVLAAAGAALLAVHGRSEVIVAWIALVVGVHLFPVAVVLQYPLIHVAAALVTAGTLSALALGEGAGHLPQRCHRRRRREQPAGLGVGLAGGRPHAAGLAVLPGRAVGNRGGMAHC